MTTKGQLSLFDRQKLGGTAEDACLGGTTVVTKMRVETE